MDRSFLSQPSVIEASRQFVCIRLLTYENAAEAQVLKSLFVGRSGELENTTFAILKPDGQGVLVKGHRSPSHEFADARQLADTMNGIARPFAALKRDGSFPLPLLPTVRLGLNTAACDNRPLAVIVSADSETRKRLEEDLAALAWSADYRGRFVYASAVSAKELAAVKGVQERSALLVIQPDRFGKTGAVLAQVDASASRGQLAAVLTKGAASHQRREQTFQAHVREGQGMSVFWETAIPVTDPLERRARERGRNAPPPGP